ncbi:Major capsid protein [Armadillidium vulgare iridescent virus]|uniref:Major capsid protein n=10 Tax=unclassified Iridovirus TaxID=327984 RepID=A0A068QKK8_9VIRU|nr:Major capsid protein [Armadillidium vulgare iridescent virus]CCV02506.1 Major capsid protein [Armadillidium vulgare iridescent virus]
MSISSSNVTSGFIDIATKDEIEKYMYGGKTSTAYFVRETRKSTWFTQVPVSLTRANGFPNFGSEWSASVSRAGDYLLYTWLRLRLPAVTLLPTNQFFNVPVAGANNGRIRWTKNFMHNLIRECSITFNDLVAARFDNYHLDFWAAFTTPASKAVGYDNMIGNISALIQPQPPPVAPATVSLPEIDLNLPLPFFFSRDSGVSLPTAALPYNEMRINFQFRDWDQLLILDNINSAASQSVVPVVGAAADIAQAPVISHAAVWGNYAIVSNEERRRMGCSVRDILIEQVQTAPRHVYNPNTNDEPSYDIRFSHAIKALFFAVRNTTFKNVWSNYTTASQVVTPTTVIFEPSTGAFDPIDHTTLIYENTNRLHHMGSDYFSLVNPWYHAPTIPGLTGFHEYSYSLAFNEIDPMGSTNFGKLTNVSIIPHASNFAKTGAAGTGPAGSGQNFAQSYEFIITALNNNIIRIIKKFLLM